jgi:hypothetical protein
MRLEPFAPHHLAALDLQPSQAIFGARLAEPGYGDKLAEAGPAFTLFAGDRVVAVGGVAERWEGCAQAWMLVSCEAGPHMRWLVRIADGFFKQAPWRRIEAAVVEGFEPGARLMSLLGFEFEGRARCYGPDGRDHDLYARIRA